jgi:uroporphyrinogen decarboxylase
VNKRDRVLSALNHQEPDRVPVDLGGTDVSGISAIAYKNLKSYLGLNISNIRVFDPYQQLATVEEEILTIVRGDVRPIMIQAKEFKPGKLSDGSPCEIPAKWNPRVRDDGAEVVLDQCGNIIAVRPLEGQFFNPVYEPLRDCQSADDLDGHMEDIINSDMPAFSDMTFEEMGAVARQFREQTDYLLVGGNFAAHILAGSQFLRGWDVFLLDLLEHPVFAETLMDRLADAHCKRFDKYWAAVGQYLDVVAVHDDLGTQVAPILSPELYRKMIKPYHRKVYSHIKKKSGAFVFLHSDGSIYQLIPDLIEAGVDILNPVQVTAANMDTKKLKAEFGDNLVFWGGGCDTQRILPRGTRGEIRDEVKRRIDDLAPGGGFVFSQVHNILPEVPPENIMAMYEAVWEFGKY